MKNKLFYLVGTALLMCSTGIFTSCINGVDDEYLELQGGTCTGGGSDDDEGGIEDLNGEYSSVGELGLKMTYNGYELNGKKITFTLNDDQESATMIMTGTEVDLKNLASVFEGMESKFTTYSPIPGEKELIVKNVKVKVDGSTCTFEGEDIKPNRTFTFTGNISDETMNIDIKHMLVRENNDLLGKWKMGEAKEGGTIGMAFNSNNDPATSSPLWLDWGSNANVDMGSVTLGITIDINRPMNGIFNLLMSNMVTTELGKQLGLTDGIEKSIPKLIEFIAAEETGGMYASYSWNGTQDPQYSQDMSHNIIRYYFDENNQLRIEPDVDLLLNLIGGLVSGASTRSITTRDEEIVLPQHAIEVAGKILDILKPALAQGIPCEYEINGNNLSIYLDKKLLLDLMRLVDELVNDKFVIRYIYPEIEKIGAYSENIKSLLKNMHNALGEEDCTGIKLGLRLVKMADEPEVGE